MLDEDASYITDYLTEEPGMSKVHEAFWQGELYLQSLHAQAGEKRVADTMEEIGEVEQQFTQESPQLSQELDDSLLLARQNFISTARFGYFIARCRQRWALEQRLRASSTQVVAGNKGSRTRALERYVMRASPEDLVELSRISSKEASIAVDMRATELFGEIRDLLKPGVGNMAKLEMTIGEAERLTMEAAAFGAALFETEEVAARHYSLHYTEFGARHGGPLGSG
eukprot:TRINITY_DN28284_c0_g4_i1.p1 TRINITY_DN28284_c0_g4~~TRINITY_DN28284_c0_g4_i1.p1  ORF type:complete len:226 (-),score=50.12 TRINITY_DN28284_c0_g4_i1:8-685(-)